MECHDKLATALAAMLFCCWAAAAADDMDVQAMSNSAERVVRVVTSSARVRRSADTSKTWLTFDERLDFLRAHNRFRREVSPTASNMEFMVWDPILASMAQEWANGCKFDHGNPKRSDAPYSPIGQNLWAGTGDFNPDGAATAWNNELKDYTYSSKSCAAGAVCGHYTQNVWASSDHVGCGVRYCESMSNFGPGKGLLLVCNYGPAGNYKGAAPYKQGAACSECATDKPKCENRLCIAEKKCGDKACENGGTLLQDVCECQCTADKGGDTCTGSPGDQGAAAVKAVPALFLLTVGVVLACVG